MQNRIETPMSMNFFSKKNINDLQLAIINKVRIETGVVISHQSESQILTIMNNVINAYGEFNSTSSIGHTLTRNQPVQLMNMNQQVVRNATDNIKTGILNYTQYIKDASSLPEPIPRGIMSKEDTTIEMNTRFF